MSSALTTDVHIPADGPNTPAPVHDDQGEHLPAVSPAPDIDDAALAEARRLADEPAQQRSIRVPKSRLDEVLGRLEQTEGRLNEVTQQAEAWRQRAIYMEGALAARAEQRPAAPQQQVQQPQQPSPEQLIVAEEAKKLAAAEQFDRGELSAAQMQQIMISADRQIAAVRERALFAAAMANVPQPTPGITDMQIIDAETVALEAMYPYTAVLRERDYAYLEEIARNTFRALGRQTTTSPNDILALRRMVARLAEALGPFLYPDAQVGQSQQPASGQQQRTTAPPLLGAQQQQRGSQPAFVARQAAHPPNVHNAGSTAGSMDDFSDARIERMSTEEIAALPLEVRARLLS